MVGMAELVVVKGDAIFNCLGLGSCIGLLATDIDAGVSGMVHIMLPEAFANKPVDKIGKFADTGIPELIRQIEAKGGNKARLKLAYAGGAHVFKFSNGSDNKIEVGNRNIEAVEKQLKLLGLKPVATDVGGSQGRTVTYDSSTGIYKVKTISQGEKVLCTLKGQNALRAA